MVHDYSENSDNTERATQADSGRSRSRINFIPADYKSVTRELKKLLARLNRLFTIRKASLACYDGVKDCLRVTHMFSGGTLKSSLALTIPNYKSLLYQVLAQGYPVVDNYPELITSSIIEKKILLGPSTRSILIIPLVHDGDRLGLLSLASPNESEFGLYLEGTGPDIVVEFAAQLSDLLSPVENPV
jgi:hypothetical protein